MKSASKHCFSRMKRAALCVDNPTMYSDDMGDNPLGVVSHVSFTSAIAAADGPLLGTILSFPSLLAAKLAARAGFQWAMIDMEHSPFTMEQVTELVHTVYTTSQGQCLPVIRIPSHGTEYVKWALDTGAAGIIIPMVHRPSEMRDILDKALYPPQGSRSFGPYSAPFGDFHTRTFGDYYSKAKRGKIAIFPTIESREGVENVEEILRLDGVSGIFIGPYDLRLSLGLSGGSDGPETEFVAALGKIFSTGNKLAKPVGIPARGDHLSTTRTEQGASFLLSSFDYTALQAGLQADLRSAQQGVKRSTKT